MKTTLLTPRMIFPHGDVHSVHSVSAPLLLKVKRLAGPVSEVRAWILRGCYSAKCKMYPESPKAKFKVHPPERLEHSKCSCCYEPRSSLHSSAQSTHISLNLAHGATASTSPSVIQSQGGDKHTSCFLLMAALYPIVFTVSFRTLKVEGFSNPYSYFTQAIGYVFCFPLKF